MASGGREGRVQACPQLVRAKQVGPRQGPHDQVSASWEASQPSGDQMPQPAPNPVAHHRAADRPRDYETGPGGHSPTGRYYSATSRVHSRMPQHMDHDRGAGTTTTSARCRAQLAAASQPGSGGQHVRR